MIRGTDEFLNGLRKICTDENILLLFDEVMTGFRVAKGGAQEIVNIRPDLTTFGKIIGGGLPVGAFGGKKEIMEMIAPSGPVYQAGTLSGNPLAMTAGIAALSYIKEHPDVYSILEDKASMLENGFKDNLKKINKNFALNRAGSMSCLFFTEEPVVDFKSALKSDTSLYGKYFNEMLNKGIYLAPAQFEAAFISLSHTTEDLEKTIDAQKWVLKKII